jgi:uncharacterized protein YprB with RNaseH-like and TPR domain
VELRRKLALLEGSGLGAVSRSQHAHALPTEDAAPRIDRLRSGIATLRLQRSPSEAVLPARSPWNFPAEQRPTPLGVLHVRERWFDADHRHGRAGIGAALEAEGDILAALALDPALREVDPRSMLLVDTETTGLSGGTGTLPFLVGVAGFEHGRLRVSQYLLRRPGEERPILGALAERWAAASCIVTYNGKSFDWPLLRCRYVMNRLPVPQPRPHLDLLHCARRVLRHHASGARLVALEESLLGHVRSDDIPGEQIPERYFRYLRCGDGALLSAVLEHNVHDVLLLAALLGVLAHEFRSGTAPDPRTSLGYAAVAERAGDVPRALAFASAAAASDDPVVRVQALILAARVQRRRKDDRAAVELLERAVRAANGESLARIHLELAKLYEHRLGDPAHALEHAGRALSAEGPEEHRRRVQRLLRRP